MVETGRQEAPKRTQKIPKELKRIKIISHKNRDEWELIPKYHIGKKPSKDEE